MTVMEQALRDAGVKLKTHKELIWQFLKDHPSQSAAALVAALKLPPERVNNSLWMMERRGMVASTTHVEREHSSRGNYRNIKRYTAVGATFEMLPLVKKAVTRVSQKAVPQPVTAVEPQQEKPATLVQQAKKVEDFDLDGLTIRQARALYDKLHRMFGV